MTIKELIQNSSMDEMAQQHFDDEVVDLIKAGEFEKAAEKYIDNHGSAKLAQKATATTGKLARGDFAKTLKADPEKVSKIPKTAWDSFNQAYADLMGTSEQEKRGYKKTKGSVDSATGKIKTSAQSGASRAASINKLEAKIQKIAGEYQSKLEAAETDEEKEEARSHLEGLQILGQALQNTKKGKGTIPPESEAQIKKLEDKYAKIEAAMGKKMDRPVAKYGDEAPRTDDEQDKVEKEAQRRLKKRMHPELRTIDDIEDEIEDFRRRAESKKKGQEAYIPPRMEEAMKNSGKILAESYSYTGTRFWENYTGTSVLRMFNKDVKEIGAKEAKEIYIETFGEETAPIFEYMAGNEELLEEAANVKGIFLFEVNGRRNVNGYLAEAPMAFTAGIGGGSSVGKMAKVMSGGSAKKGLATVADKAGKAGGLMGWLTGLWDKFKAFGKPIVKKLGAFVASGAKWAKEIAQKGMTFLHTNPIARVAVPAVALAGTVAGGIALINKLRKKAGKNKLSKEEENKMRATAGRKEDQLRKYGAKVA